MFHERLKVGAKVADECSRPRPTWVRTSDGRTPTRARSVNSLHGLILLLVVCPILASQVGPAVADFSDNCPRDCNCKWANGKREADCTRAGFTTIPTNLNHEIQILRMTYNYVRILGKNVYKSAGLLNLQRIFMNHCHVQVSRIRTQNLDFLWGKSWFSSYLLS